MLQRHLHFALSLFCSATHHNLPVLFESCILYLLTCSEHRYTRCAQTPHIKHVMQRVHNVRVQAVPELDKNKAQICCSERTSGNGIMLDHPLPLKLHQSYLFVEINPPVAQEIWSGQPQQCRSIDCCDARLSSVRCVALSRHVQL